MDASAPPRLALGDAWFDQVSGLLDVAGASTRLRPQTAAVLTHLVAREGQVVSREDLWRAVWGDTVVTDNSLAQCISEIRRALGPSREGWVETLARRGYVVRLPLAAASTALPVAPDEAPAGAPPSPPSSRPLGVSRAWRLRWVAPSLLLVLASAWVLWRPAPPAEPPRISLAVLPFETPAGSPDAAWFADVVGEDITFNLARIPGAHVVSRVSTQGYPAAGADVRQIGRELGVRYVVAGQLHREGQHISLHLHLADTASGELRWSERIDTTQAELAASERLVADRVAQALHVTLVNAEASRVQAQVGAHPQADDLALQAWAAWNRGSPQDVARAHALSLQALALDERSVLAWKTQASWYLRARINQSMPADEAVAGATAAAERAMALAPDHPLAHTVWGASLALRGRYDEARTALEHEIQTNPSHPVAYHYLGLTQLMLGQPQVAIELYRRALAISPRDPRLSRFERYLALSYLHDGQMAPALLHARAATHAPLVDRSAWALLAAVCALNQDTACAQAAVARLREKWPQFTVALAEAEWPPVTPAFTTQHAAFLRGLAQAGL